MYCTYLTIYYGDKLPRRYIGSSKVETVLNGYNGSIKSKKYKEIYKAEQSENKHLFKTRILNTYHTHAEALNAEFQLHDDYDVSKSSNYMNMAKANRNGCFGNGVSGKDHPMYGKRLSEESKKKISDSLKEKYSKGEIVSPFATMNFEGENNSFYGKTHSEASKEKMRKPKKFVPKFECPCCGKSYDGGNLTRHMRSKKFSESEIELCKSNSKTKI